MEPGGRAKSPRVCGRPPPGARSNLLATAALNRGRHGLVHAFWIGTFYEVRCPAVSRKQAFQLFVRNACQQRRVVNLVSIKVQDGQNRSISNGIEKLADVPGSCKWSGFRFPVADYRSHNQLRVVEGRAASMREYIP